MAHVLAVIVWGLVGVVVMALGSQFVLWVRDEVRYRKLSTRVRESNKA